MPDDAAMVVRLTHLCRMLGYGQLVIEVVAGKPRAVRIIPTVRLDQPLWDGLPELLQEMGTSSLTN